MSTAVPTGWETRDQPPQLFRRFEFPAYAQTRAFLAALETLSKDQGYYPDLGFAARHVNVRIVARGGRALGEVDYDFARRVTALAAVG